MSFTNKLTVAFTVAVLATLAISAFGPLVPDIVQIISANIFASAAIGLPVLTTATLLIASFALQL